jgi:TIR domain
MPGADLFGVTDENICHGRPGAPRSTLTNFESRSTLPLNELLDAMSDIFISYAKADHALAAKLSAFFESEGWTVWWDKSLGAADLYRDEVMKQLAASRAVITIWTENSVKSDWVRAEAGRAKAEGKLIPVKTPDVAYAAIPLPFGEMHTENVGSTDLIRAAVVGQLAKPKVTPSTFWQITSTFKYNVLTWIGIVGSAITLFANLGGVLNLADWARELVEHWHEWNQMIWGWVFSFIKVRVPGTLVPIISFAVFVMILVAGLNLQTRQRSVQSHTAPTVMRKVRIFSAGVLLYFLLMSSVPVVLSRLVSDDYALLATAVIILLGFPLGYLLYFARERSLVLVNSLLLLAMGICLVLVPLDSIISKMGVDQSAREMPPIVFSVSYIVMPLLLWMAVILFSPLQQLTRRLSFVVLGVIILIGLSEISKLNFHQYLQPPKVPHNSVR